MHSKFKPKIFFSPFDIYILTLIFYDKKQKIQNKLILYNTHDLRSTITCVKLQHLCVNSYCYGLLKQSHTHSLFTTKVWPCAHIYWFSTHGSPWPEKIFKLKKWTVHKCQNTCQARTCVNTVKSSSPNTQSTWLTLPSRTASILLLAFSLFVLVDTLHSVCVQKSLT
jgi:hypothetical protein